MEIPQQNRAENFASYVLRVCNTIDSVRIPLTSEANSFRESERDKDARVEKVNGKQNVCVSMSKGRMTDSIRSILKLIVSWQHPSTKLENA